MANSGKIVRTAREHEQAGENIQGAGRLMLKLSQRDLLLCGISARQLTQQYDGTDNDLPITVRHYRFRGRCNRFTHRLEGFEQYFYFYEKKLDSSIDDWVVKMAINILRGEYRGADYEKYDMYWKFVRKCLLKSQIATIDGLVW